MKVFVGVDGGGTKTEAIAVDGTGKKIGEVNSGPTNPNATPYWKESLRSISQQLALPEKTNVRIFAGISGAGTSETREELIEAFRELFSAEIEVEPDPLNILYGGLYGSAGIVQICGTGSITYGVNEKGDYGRIGGWGYLLGDRGSGYEIGRRGLLASIESEEGLGFPTVITEYIYNKFRGKDCREILQKIYSSTAPKELVSPLSKIVIRAAEEGDKVALNILYEEALMVCSYIFRLEKELFAFKKQPVILAGGVLSTSNPFQLMVKNELDRKGISTFLPEHTPVEGALIGAVRKENGIIKKNVLAAIGGRIWGPQLED
ncbi:hypothetical protein AAV35_002620 [Salimicrobium jeotgali]|uniref:ATPase BadF/BadG/BcrA/BcrD type domain-containing protein n=1 Tax=Salimicrobium jeotgali TaxID=1230341 RepID=K2H660_9BACI|nr:BadF/BadG/BcrA/BcrD ATPase family protein [Salimicrobium jeotgali]AKG03789.1 hypothetical protein AAV35_002620 [Salimicrobium jeotgali]EKE31275.1 hypothetical protein MJ3_09223 [Salimicrobium jeotgali]MBM7697087.1 N-acetylglucosamine kinase-like BadF-type ATPase [Salimicrobium jeotgali]